MAEIRVNATGGLKLFDADDSHYAQIVAGTITSNVDAITLGHDVVSIVDNLALTSDSSVLKFGADNDTTLTHTDGTGLTLNSTNKLTFGDAASYINQSSDGVLTIAGEATIDLTASTAVLVSNDLKLDSDSSVIGFGADNDTTLTHTDGTGLTLNSANKLTFRDTGLYIASNADGDLDIVSDGTAVDSINLESAGGITLDAGTAASGVIFEDDGTEMLRIHNSSSDVYIESKVSDKDIYLRGNDGGSGVNALKLDMSDAGAATLNNGLTLTDGNLVVADGHGIDFSATSSVGTMTSELLDDYEEGTWTPSLGGNTAYTAQNGQYTKIGRCISIQGYLSINTIGTGSTTSITGLPIAANQPQPPSVIISKWTNLSQDIYDLAGVIPGSGGTQINATGITAATASNTENLAVFQNSTVMFFSCTYFTA